MRLTFRTATRDDLEFLIALKEEAYRGHIESLGLAWDPRRNEANVLAAVESQTLALISGSDGPVGALAVQWDTDPVFLAGIELSPALRGQGLGTRIVRDVLARAAKSGRGVRLQVLRPNPAIRLYERLGFVLASETDTHIAMTWRPE